MILAVSVADNISISSAKYSARQELKVAGTGNVNGSKLTLYSSDSTGAVLTPLMHNNAPMTTEVFGCINSVCTFEFRVKGSNIPMKSNYVVVKSETGGVAGPFMMA